VPKKPKQIDPYFWQFCLRYQEEVGSMKKISTQITTKSIFTALTLRFGHLRMSQLTSRDIQIYMTELSRDLAPLTVRRYWSVLSNVLRYAEDENLVTGFKTPRLPKNHRKPQDWFTLAEMQTIIARTETGPLKVLFMVLAETGCRVGEALALQSKHLDLENKTIRIEQNTYLGFIQTTKTVSSTRTVAITDKLCYALNTIRNRAQPEEFIFDWKYAQVVGLLETILERTKISHRGLHAFRRGNITWLIRDVLMPEIVVGDRVGHRSEGMTLGVYVQKKEGQDREWMPRIERELYGAK